MPQQPSYPVPHQPSVPATGRTRTLVGHVIYSDTGTGALVLNGSSTETAVYHDSPSGTITLSGSATDRYSETYIDARSGTITLAGSATDNHFILYTDARAGTLTLAGSATDNYTRLDLASGTITLSGSAVESNSLFTYPPFLFHWHTGLDRIANIEQWLHDNTPFTQPTHKFLWAFRSSEYTMRNRLDNIEKYLLANQLFSSAFLPGDKAGTDRLWAIESYLLKGTGSSG